MDMPPVRLWLERLETLRCTVANMPVSLKSCDSCCVPTLLADGPWPNRYGLRINPAGPVSTLRRGLAIAINADELNVMTVRIKKFYGVLVISFEHCPNATAPTFYLPNILKQSKMHLSSKNNHTYSRIKSELQFFVANLLFSFS